MLSPPAQLKVDKFPHHKGLCEADGGQDSYPSRERNKSIALYLTHKTLFLCAVFTKVGSV